MPKSILRHLHITDWQLRHPEQLPYAPQPMSSQAQPVCWVVGALPEWIADLCLVLPVATYQHLAQADDLPAKLAAHDWVLWSGDNIIPAHFSHHYQLSFTSAASAKQQLWHQICQYEY